MVLTLSSLTRFGPNSISIRAFEANFNGGFLNFQGWLKEMNL
jgi:hypothetical protein